MQFLRTRRFMKDVKRLAMTEAELEALEATIAARPTAGDVVPGLKGLRKLRFGFGGRGKRGGGRCIYALVMNGGLVALLRAYAKNEADDLTPEERRQVVALLKEIEDAG
ncbi:addiction module toxin RelE [Falsiroseomonas sp.]|uniref:addiction module toxin RelE n=1 Tax=Falsiroseomonas sp. TaxID=2870721 RepID=UPI003F6EAB30